MNKERRNGALGNMNGNSQGNANGYQGNMNGYQGNMNNYQGNMNGYQGNMNGHQGNRDDYRDDTDNMRVPGRTSDRYADNMTADALLEEIRALGFVKVELELFLDTHPDCRVALDYYGQTVEALKRLTDRYHEEVGPLVATGVTDNDKWTWVNTPWPWQVGNGAPEKGGRK